MLAYLNKILTFGCCFIFICCSGNDKKDNPVSPSLPDVEWTQQGLDSCMVYSLIFSPAGSLFAGTNYGLYKSSNNGQKWNLIDQDISKSSINCFYIHPEGYLLAGTSNGIYISSNDGNNWENKGLLNTSVTSIAINSENKIFAGTRNKGIFISDTGYAEWIQTYSDFNSQIFSSLLISPQGIIYAGSAGVYRSNDNGKTWNLKNNGLGNWQVYSLIFDNKNNICAGTDLGGFFSSSDNGEKWLKLNSGLDNTEITTLTINNAGHIFAGTWRGGVYHSSNNGENWTVVNSGLTNKAIYSLIVSPDNYLFAGTPRGIFRTRSGL